MAENSEPSEKIGKRRTTKTEPLTPGQALEILQQAVRECQQSGMRLRISPLYHAGTQNAMIVLEGVDFIDGNFMLANAGN